MKKSNEKEKNELLIFEVGIQGNKIIFTCKSLSLSLSQIQKWSSLYIPKAYQHYGLRLLTSWLWICIKQTAHTQTLSLMLFIYWQGNYRFCCVMESCLSLVNSRSLELNRKWECCFYCHVITRHSPIAICNEQVVMVNHVLMEIIFAVFISPSP